MQSTNIAEGNPGLSDFDQLRSDLEQNPVDPTGWNNLISLAESSGDSEKIKIAFNGLLEHYPNSVSAQIAYLNHFLNNNAFETAEELFKKFLKTASFVELWKFYITYIRRINAGASPRETVRQSYEFALARVGQDKDSGELWIDYINFIKAGPTTSTWEEQQKMDALRKVYHRAVQVPIENIESVWSELEAFETSLNRITAKKFMADLSPGYMQARTVLRQLQKYLTPLFPPSSTLTLEYDLPSPPTFNARDRGLVGNWKTYLKWEESNPLEIDLEKEKQVFIVRVQNVYRKAIVKMRFFSEIWYMAYLWTSSIGKKEESLSILKAGIKANPASFLLNFAIAEVFEVEKQLDEIYLTYDKLLNRLKLELVQLKAEIDAEREEAAVTDADGFSKIETNGDQPGRNVADATPKERDLSEKRKEYGLVWIMYIRAARRVESHTKAREIFKAARLDAQWTPWDVYESVALMEYHVARDTTVASRIFELGMKPEKFAGEIQYVLRYLGFLISVNDEQNARALFERVVHDGRFSSEAARPLWERWARYEYQYSTLDAAQKLEARMAEVYPMDPPIKRFAQRHIYLGTDAIASRDLGFAVARQAAPSAPSAAANNNATSVKAEQPTGQTAAKRAPSPDQKREDARGVTSEQGPSHKRARPFSPQRGDRDRHDSGGARRNAPAKRADEDKSAITLPPVVSWFIGQLPPAVPYDGPSIRTEEMMNVFRNVVIPSGPLRDRSPPSQRPQGGRPPPDYGPYQGPYSGGTQTARAGRRF